MNATWDAHLVAIRARWQRDAQRQTGGPTCDEIQKKWGTLGEEWGFAWKDAVLFAFLKVWARTEWTLKEVAAKYSEHQAQSVAHLLAFDKAMASSIMAVWPIWRQQSLSIEDDRWYQASESLRVCSGIHHLHAMALRMRMDYDQLLLVPSFTVCP